MRAIPSLLLTAAFAAGLHVSASRTQRGEARSTLEVGFDEWTTPSKPPFAHDVAIAPDGYVWYTAQRANALGRLDPRMGTGEFKEYPCPRRTLVRTAWSAAPAATSGIPAIPQG